MIPLADAGVATPQGRR